MSELPSGTVTFLFTDIQGSTALWENFPAEMSIALARHDAILREAVRTHHGHVFKTVGDAFCAAFGLADCAIAAAVHAQRGLNSECWPLVGRLRVRTAIHSGTAEIRDGDYFGRALNRVARVLSIAHGGQILLTNSSQALAGGRLPSGCTIRDLGQHHLRDMHEPDRIFQLVHPDLQVDFPPLKTSESAPNNLPAPQTRLIGRTREATTLGNLLKREDTRLVTLTGPGGTGKTRLAMAVASDIMERFEDGVFVASLAPINDPALIAGLISRTLGLPETGNRSSFERIKEHLKSKRLLLVLDNFEQILGGSQVVAELLSACPHLKVLVTSRSPLHLRGERELLLTPLSTPPREKRLTLEELSQYESVALFVDRASDVKADFALNERNAATVAEICARLDGLPLAIELAAARVKMLSPGAILDRMALRLPLLIDGASDLPARQRTLRATVAWSVDLLSEAERVLFYHLSVFVGSFDIQAAEGVCNIEGTAQIDVLAAVGSLVDKSLLQHHETASGLSRFSFLETIREYAAERFATSSDAAAVRRRHAQYFASLAETLAPPDRWGYRDEIVDQLECEHDNLRAALEWAVQESTEIGLHLVAALWRFWHRQGYSSEGRTWVQRLLEPSPAATEKCHRVVSRARALNAGGMLAMNQDDLSVAGTMFREALRLATEVRDENCIAEALHGLGMVALHMREFSKSVQFFEQSLALGRRLERAPVAADALMYLGLLAQQGGDLARANALLQESVTARRRSDDGAGLGPSLSALGYVALEQADLETARACFQERLAIWRARRERRNIALAICSLGELSLALGDIEGARTRFEEGLAIFRSKAEPGGFAIILACFAILAVHDGQRERAVRLAGAAAKARNTYGSMLAPSLRLRLEHMIDIGREAIEGPLAAGLWAEGQAMSLEQAIELALNKGRT